MHRRVAAWNDRSRVNAAMLFVSARVCCPTYRSLTRAPIGAATVRERSPAAQATAQYNTVGDRAFPAAGWRRLNAILRAAPIADGGGCAGERLYRGLPFEAPAPDGGRRAGEMVKRGLPRFSSPLAADAPGGVADE
jgi:hypothetical protein